MSLRTKCGVVLPSVGHEKSGSDLTGPRPPCVSLDRYDVGGVDSGVAGRSLPALVVPRDPPLSLMRREVLPLCLGASSRRRDPFDTGTRKFLKEGSTKYSLGDD